MPRRIALTRNVVLALCCAAMMPRLEVRAVEPTKSVPASVLGIATEQLGTVKELRIENTVPGEGGVPTIVLSGRDARAQLLITGLIPQAIKSRKWM